MHRSKTNEIVFFFNCNNVKYISETPEIYYETNRSFKSEELKFFYYFKTLKKLFCHKIIGKLTANKIDGF